MNDAHALPIRIRKASPLHVRRLHRLFGEAVRSHFSYFSLPIQNRVIAEHGPWQLTKAIMHPRRIVLVAHRGNQLVGYAIGSVPTNRVGQFYWLYVQPDARGQKVGLALLSRMIQLQRDKGAQGVLIATHDHRPYYERQGFSFVEDSMVDGVPMAVMEFRLGGGQ